MFLQLDKAYKQRKATLTNGCVAGTNIKEVKILINESRTRWKLTAIVLALTLIVSIPSVFILASNVGFNVGKHKGYGLALRDVQHLLKDTGVLFEWTELGDGQYNIQVTIPEKGLIVDIPLEIHLRIRHYRNGVLLSDEIGAGYLTNIGKDWIEQQMGASDGTQEALYCADSNDATDPPEVTWTILPSEITANGLDRQTGVYTSTGTGQWEVEVTKAVTGTQSTQLWGLHWIVTDASDNNLLCADSGPSQKNCENGDTLTETWTLTVSGV